VAPSTTKISFFYIKRAKVRAIRAAKKEAEEALLGMVGVGGVTNTLGVYTFPTVVVRVVPEATFCPLATENDKDWPPLALVIALVTTPKPGTLSPTTRQLVPV